MKGPVEGSHKDEGDAAAQMPTCAYVTDTNANARVAELHEVSIETDRLCTRETAHTDLSAANRETMRQSPRGK